MAKKSRVQVTHSDPAETDWDCGRTLVRNEPLLWPLLSSAKIIDSQRGGAYVPPWVAVTAQGAIWCNTRRDAEPEQWAYAIAHGLLHLGFGHLHTRVREDRLAWTAACCLTVSRFLAEQRLWSPLADLNFQVNGTDYLVPMCVEEPSVIAITASSSGLLPTSRPKPNSRP